MRLQLRSSRISRSVIAIKCPRFYWVRITPPETLPGNKLPWITYCGEKSALDFHQQFDQRPAFLGRQPEVMPENFFVRPLVESPPLLRQRNVHDPLIA